MEQAGIVRKVFAILYGCPQETTEEDLISEMERRYAVASGLIQGGAQPQAIVDAIEGFDGAAPYEQNEILRAGRDAAARSLCRLQKFGYLEAKILAEKYAGELGIQWASQFGKDVDSSRPTLPPFASRRQ